MNQSNLQTKEFKFFFVVAGVSFSLFAFACGSPSANVATTNTSNNVVKQPPAPSPSIDEMASGQKVYAQNCAACHKENGKGGKVVIDGKSLDPDDLTDYKIANFSDEKLTRYIVNGMPDDGMPAFKDKLSEGEIRDVVKYIRKEFHKK